MIHLIIASDDQGKKEEEENKQPYSGGEILDTVLKPLLKLFKTWANHFAV